MPQMCSGTRWLSSYDRALETITLMDSYLIFYFSFLSEKDSGIYRIVLSEIFKRRKIDEMQKKRLKKITWLLSQKKGTQEGKQRKQMITEALFYTSEDTKLQLKVYSAVLSIFKEYVCTFQTSVPMAHKLHDMQMECMKKFVCCFLKPEHIPIKLQKLLPEVIQNPPCHLSSRDLYIGVGQTETTAPKTFSEQVRQGYVAAALLMLKKITNK